MTTTLDIVCLGPVAATLAGCDASGLPPSLLAHINAAPAKRGRVAAVFETTFYIEADNSRFLCVGAPNVGKGPIMAIVAARPAPSWNDAGVHEGETVVFERGLIRVGRGLSFALANAVVWKPPPWPDVVPEVLGAAIAALQLRMRHPSGQVQRQASPNQAPPALADRTDRNDAASLTIERRVTLSMATLADWLDYHLSGSAELDDAGRDAVMGLIGLGPGLTPSGDDVIAGLILALHAAARRETANQLAAFVRAIPPDATSKLSRWLLEAAIAGHPSEAMHAMIVALLSGDTAALPAALAGLEAIGHTSGTDMLAGALLGLTAIAARASQG